MRTAPSLPIIDLFKAVACCLIVLHHLAFYGPMADHAALIFPAAFEWLSAHARLAVQVFLVVGGWLAARSILRHDTESGKPAWVARILQRYLRLAVPLWGALMVAVLCNALADVWMDHHSISSSPQLGQVVAHVLLLQDVTGHEALSAGVWYVAIDFQLHVMLAVLASWAARHRHPRLVLGGACAVLVAVSAFIINRDASWDVAAPYFWCSYGLGVMAALASQAASSDRGEGPVERRAVNRQRVALSAIMVLAVLAVAAALVMEFRWRLLVALVTAVALWGWALGARHEWALGGRSFDMITGLSRISYSVFLVHFPICLLVNATWDEFAGPSPWLHLVGVVTAFKLSLLGGFLFHEALDRWVWPTVWRIEQDVLRRLGLSASAA